jgi:hypothetical protein
MNIEIIEIENKIAELQTLVRKFKMQSQPKNEFEMFKEFILDNFEKVEDTQKFLFCKDIIRFCIVHCPQGLSPRTYENYLSKIFISGTKRIDNKTYKVKHGVVPIKLGEEF